MAQPNEAMAALWNGPSGSSWVAHDERHDRQLAGWGREALEAAAIGAGDRVLDVGCGTGTLTRTAGSMASPGGRALGVDISQPLVDAARARTEAEGPADVTFELGDAQVHPFPAGELDVVISRFGVMFFDDLEAAFANLRRALVPGGRLAFVCWQDLQANEWAYRPSAAMAEHVGFPAAYGAGQPGPYSLAEPDRVRAVLGAAGFEQVALDGKPGPMWLGSDADDAYGYVQQQPMNRVLLAEKDPRLVERALAALRATLDEVAGPDGVVLPGNAWLVTARAA